MVLGGSLREALRPYRGEDTPSQARQVPVPDLLQRLDEECPICGARLVAVGMDGYWQLGCTDGCTHDNLVAWLSLSDLRVDPWEGLDGWIAMRLATSPEMWGALLMGVPVVKSAMDQEALRWYEQTGVL